jgi:hypothetical protein
VRTSFYSILCIVIRLGAVFLAFGALLKIPSTFAAAKQGIAPWSIATALFVMALILVLALLLWVYPGVIARLAAGRNSREVFESPIAPAELQWIALSVLGVYFAFDAFVVLANYVVQVAFLLRISLDSEDDRQQFISDMSYYALQLAGGLALAFGARGLTAMLRRMRYGSAAAADESDSTTRDTTG